jgi:hypothetical protein
VVIDAHATEFLATGTAVRRLADEHKLPDTTPKHTFTLGLDPGSSGGVNQEPSPPARRTGRPAEPVSDRAAGRAGSQKVDRCSRKGTARKSVMQSGPS